MGVVEEAQDGGRGSVRIEMGGSRWRLGGEGVAGGARARTTGDGRPAQRQGRRGRRRDRGDRTSEGDTLPRMLFRGVSPVFARASFEELSLSAIERRWAEEFRSIPEPTPESEARGRALLDLDERRRLTSMSESAAGRALAEDGT
jgi:hypothetical protein